MKDLKKGSAETVILSLLEEEGPLHGYGIAKLVEERTNGEIEYHAASLYPILYRLEEGGLICGSWERSESDRRRRRYELTVAGREALQRKRREIETFIGALRRVTGISRG